MSKIIEDAIVVYTDGSLHPKGRKGGYGMLFLDVDAVGNETKIEEYAPPGVRGTTGNRMELQAAIDAVERVPYLECYGTAKRVVIKTDSRYVADGYQAMGFRARSGWRNAAGKPLDNTDLWKDLLRAQRRLGLPLGIVWVKGHGKGHQKDVHNYRADALARESAVNPLARREFRSSVRRKIVATKTKGGSVSISGQEMTIYVVEVQRLAHQKTWKYRYQVMDRASPDYGCTDWIYSEHFIRDGHCYEVRVNDDPRYPQIVEVKGEVPKPDTDG